MEISGNVESFKRGKLKFLIEGRNLETQIFFGQT